MVRHGGSSAGSYLADPTSPIPSHCASIVATSTELTEFFTDLLCNIPCTKLHLPFFFYACALFTPTFSMFHLKFAQRFIIWPFESILLWQVLHTQSKDRSATWKMSIVSQWGLNDARTSWRQCVHAKDTQWGQQSILYIQYFNYSISMR